MKIYVKIYWLLKFNKIWRKTNEYFFIWKLIKIFFTIENKMNFYFYGTLEILNLKTFVNNILFNLFICLFKDFQDLLVSYSLIFQYFVAKVEASQFERQNYFDNHPKYRFYAQQNKLEHLWSFRSSAYFYRNITYKLPSSYVTV